MIIRQQPSPNFDARAAGKRISTIVLHYTGMPSAAEALARMCDPAAKVSAHYLIDEAGAVTQLVAEDKRAWHAGLSCWQGETDMNSVSVGIELVNPGHQCGYRPFPPAQIAACVTLTSAIMARYGLQAAAVVGHSDIAPKRKEDPGEYFPWENLAQQGIGLWPQAISPVSAPLDFSIVRRCLRQIGYDCATEGEYDMALRRVLLAFQRHWVPAHLSGLADAKTSAMLLALAAMTESTAAK